jgi:hypothetical protein
MKNITKALLALTFITSSNACHLGHHHNVVTQTTTHFHTQPVQPVVHVMQAIPVIQPVQVVHTIPVVQPVHVVRHAPAVPARPMTKTEAIVTGTIFTVFAGISFVAAYFAR